MASATKEDRGEEKKGKKPMHKFRLRRDAGTHYEPNTEFDPAEPEDEDNFREHEYSAGDTVKSRRPLDKLFSNKFVRLSGDVPKGTYGGDDPEDPDQDPNKDRPVRSTEHALKRDRDRYLDDEELEDGEDAPSKEQLRKLNKGRRTGEMKASEKYGDDVTSDFEGAQEADYRVFEKNGKYSIFDGDDLEKPLKKGLKKGKVGKAIEQLNEEEE